MMEKECWHFLPSDGRMKSYGPDTPYGGTVVEPGVTYSISGEPRLCEYGFHGSEKAYDALQYAPGPILCRVKMSGIIHEEFDKMVAQERTVIWMADATEVIKYSIDWCRTENRTYYSAAARAARLVEAAAEVGVHGAARAYKKINEALEKRFWSLAPKEE